MDVVPVLVIAGLLAACAANPPERPAPGRHLTPPPPAASIPDVVRQPPVPAPPEPEGGLELYTVVVHEVPVRELLSALARDAQLDIDIHPGIDGTVSLNALDQTLPQLLTRIARQVDIRWELDRHSLTVIPDRPFLRSYRIDYVNMTRQSSGTVNVSTAIAANGGALAVGNDSATILSQESNNRFWETLISNVGHLVGQPVTAEQEASPTIIANRESGLLTVRATGREHDELQRFLDLVMKRAQQQVLIEATIVEVELSDEYQAGIDWEWLDANNDGLYQLDTLGSRLAAPPVFTANFGRSGADDLLVTIKMLERFGNLKVLSSPKLMVLNNQTAMLKVVDNRVYFTIGVDITTASETGTRTIVYESVPHTVPIGLVMAVTPQIGTGDQIILNVRPTISRILGFVSDPSPALAEAAVVSNVPEIQVREIESILKVGSGQIAVLGGLMQDSVQEASAGVPGLSRLPVLGGLFSFRDDRAGKTELAIFLRPVVVKDPSLTGGLRDYHGLLPARPPERRPRLGGGYERLP